MSSDADRRHAPATLRNRAPILDVLRRVLPARGLVLEVASGTGEHVVHFARALPGLDWQPTDPSPDARRSIAAWLPPRIDDEPLSNLRPPLELDAAADAWPVQEAAALICINMVHISPWPATEGLMHGAGRILGTGAPLYLYGPFRRGPHPLEPSNAAFDRDLQHRDPRWGLREVDAVAACADAQGLDLAEVIEMPANNLSLVFRKR